MNVKTITKFKQLYATDPATAQCYRDLTQAFTEFLEMIYKKLEASAEPQGDTKCPSK